jgi:hypothetical protein
MHQQFNIQQLYALPTLYLCVLCLSGRLEAAQMKFLRHLLGIAKLDKEKNQCFRQKTGAQNITKEIKQYQKKWLQHVQRMATNRLPKQALQY